MRPSLIVVSIAIFFLSSIYAIPSFAGEYSCDCSSANPNQCADLTYILEAPGSGQASASALIQYQRTGPPGSCAEANCVCEPYEAPEETTPEVIGQNLTVRNISSTKTIELPSGVGTVRIWIPYLDSSWKSKTWDSYENVDVTISGEIGEARFQLGFSPYHRANPANEETIETSYGTLEISCDADWSENRSLFGFQYKMLSRSCRLEWTAN